VLPANCCDDDGNQRTRSPRIEIKAANSLAKDWGMLGVIAPERLQIPAYAQSWPSSFATSFL
jgi:hypothetical protein